MAQNPFYVYALKDPREKTARPFYIGKGTGNRAWEHVAQIDDSDKGQLIAAILASGQRVMHTIIADDLTEAQALKIEAELISAFGVRSQGGLLTNRVRPNPEHVQRQLHLNIPAGCHEKAQLGLELLKAAVLELAKANPDGISNSDADKYLGLQSDYGGGSKDYLSYSLIGLLMKEGLLQRSAGRKHIAPNA
jgi:hypothetical protein